MRHLPPLPLVLLLSALLPGALFFAGCETRSELSVSGPQGPGNEQVVTITVRNLDATAWLVTNVEPNAEVTTQNEQNPSFAFTEGQRYRIENNGGSEHPFALQDSTGTYLLRQDTGGGSLAGQSDIEFVADSDGITFTFTRSLAQETDRYRCTTHAAMAGPASAAE